MDILGAEPKQQHHPRYLNDNYVGQLRVRLIDISVVDNVIGASPWLQRIFTKRKGGYLDSEFGEWLDRFNPRDITLSHRNSDTAVVNTRLYMDLGYGTFYNNQLIWLRSQHEASFEGEIVALLMHNRAQL